MRYWVANSAICSSRGVENDLHVASLVESEGETAGVKRLSPLGGSIVNALKRFPPEAMEVLEHLQPEIRISPFSGPNMLWSLADSGQDQKVDVCNPVTWLDRGDAVTFFNNGRQALTKTLKGLGLTRGDVVTIVTTTGGAYVSSCVTEAIAKVCKSSREIENRTRAILLIHEFGFPADLPEDMRAMSVPIIEDCAYAFGTRLRSGRIGSVGDCAIYSLPKFLPVPYGGILVSNRSMARGIERSTVSKSGSEFLLTYLRRTALKWEAWSELRRKNWRYFERILCSFGVEAYFELADDVVPGVFLVRLPNYIDAAALKVKCVTSGIESTEYYGQGGFYFPVHQCLSEYDKQYILHRMVGLEIDADFSI